MPKPPETRRPLARPTKIWVLAGVLALAAVAAVLWWWRPRSSQAPNYTGYVVTENLYLASPVSGTLLSVEVTRGARVSSGQTLFRVDPTLRTADTDRARAQIRASEAQAQQSQSALLGARADLAAADADVTRSESEFDRLAAAQSEKPGSVVLLQLDQARATLQSARKRRDGVRAQLASAQAALTAAQAQVSEAQAGFNSAQRQLSDLAPAAPGAARVEDVMFKPGESVTANVPVVSLVPDGAVKIRFYVPEARVSDFPAGRRIAVRCDGCRAGLSATVDFIASRPEYTPPTIYSLDARQKLVFMVEALPSQPDALTPGQPIDVAVDPVQSK